MASFYEEYDGVNMDKFIVWLVYVLAGVSIIVIAGAGIGLFLGVAWKIIRLVV